MVDFAVLGLWLELVMLNIEEITWVGAQYLKSRVSFEWNSKCYFLYNFEGYVIGITRLVTAQLTAFLRFILYIIFVPINSVDSTWWFQRFLPALVERCFPKDRQYLLINTWRFFVVLLKATVLDDVGDVIACIFSSLLFCRLTWKMQTLKELKNKLRSFLISPEMNV